MVVARAMMMAATAAASAAATTPTTTTASAATGLFEFPVAFDEAQRVQRFFERGERLISKVFAPSVVKDERYEHTGQFRVFRHPAHELVVHQEAFFVIFSG